MIATEGQPGCGLIQWQTITGLMGEWLCVCARVFVRVCVHICMHQCVGRAGEHVHEVFQYSEPVRFLKGDSSSTQTEGKSEKYGAPFKIKRRKSLKIHFTRDLSNFLPERCIDIYRAANKISAHILRSHCLFFTLCPVCLFSFPLAPFLFNLLIFFSIILTPPLLFSVPPSVSHCLSFLCASLLYHFYTSIFIYVLYYLLAFTLFLSPHVLLLHASPYFTPGCPWS